MPASEHTKKANTPKKSRQWQHVRESAEKSGDSPGRAIKKASGVLKKEAKKK
jgi:hypothetical protein